MFDINDFIGVRKDFQQFQQSALLRAAVERKIEIIGEALNNALKFEPQLPITHARRIVNTRNKIIHGYDEVDEVLIWEIVIIPFRVIELQIRH